MLRRHFIAGDEKPDFIITYYAPQHIPFSSNYKGVLRGYSDGDDFGHENNTVFKCILDKWEDGVGEYGIKILNWTDGTWYNGWSSKRIFDLMTHEVGSLGTYISIVNGVQEDNMRFDGTITDVIFPNEIKHLHGPVISSYLDEYNCSVVNVKLSENLETLSNHVLRCLHVLKTITIPSSVIYMDHETLKIDCENDNIMSLVPGNQSLEEIIMKPTIPPNTDTYAAPIGVYDTNKYINPNLKIRVYADCLDTYKNDAVWGQYNDLYDTINNAVVCYDNRGERNIYERDGDINEIKENDIRDRYSKIYLPNTTYFIRKDAFRNYYLTEISMPSVTEIEKSAFEDSDLKTINMQYVHKIGNRAFQYCRDLTSVTISQQASIGDNAFYGCTSLKFITIPDNLPPIGTYAFYDCRFGKNNIMCDYDKLRSAGAYIYDIENEDGGFINYNRNNDKVFIGWRLTSDIITIPEDVKYLNYYLHYGDLTELNISKNVISFFQINGRNDSSNGYEVSNIRLYDAIRTINIDKDNPIYDSRDNCNAIIETATNTLVAGSIGTTIPNGVKIIKSDAFIRQKIVNSLNTNDVEIIENNAFNECEFNIESFTISKNTISIGYVNYGDDSHIEKLIVDKDNPKYKDYNNNTMIVEKDTNTLIWSTTFNIPEGIVNIADFPFLYRLWGAPIYIPKSVINIGSHLFGLYPNKREVIYAGTINEWNNITKHQYWYTTSDNHEGDIVIHCTDGDIAL